jgi:acyl-CoA reductase-like NAD-dependent aldehyde dehydrogenase
MHTTGGPSRTTSTLTSVDPAHGVVLGTVPVLGPAEVRERVERAREAQARWWAWGPRRRRRALLDVCHLLVERADSLAELVHRETGKPLGDAWSGECLPSCEHVAYAARRAHRVLRRRRVATGILVTRRAWVEYEPYGVVAAITPWNYPLLIPASVVAGALAAGNAVVLKPSEATPLVGLELVRCVRDATGLDGLVECATGDGRTGAALVASGVDKVVVVGGVETGRRVMAAAAAAPGGPVPVTLELGGADAMIVCADADLERAARGAVWGAFYNAGQTCQGVERVYVEAPAYDAFVAAVVAEARQVTTGGEPEAWIGPLVTAAQLEKVEAQLEDARARGARVLLGGRRALPGSRFYAPTVVVDVPEDAPLWCEETFGPVLPIAKVPDAEEAVRRVNGSALGLSASVWTRDRARACRLAAALRVGSVLVNDVLVNYALPGVPFGGRRASGFGVVHGDDGLREFARPRGTVEPRWTFRREPYWFGGWLRRVPVARALLWAAHGRGWRRWWRAWRAWRGRS